MLEALACVCATQPVSCELSLIADRRCQAVHLLTNSETSAANMHRAQPRADVRCRADSHRYGSASSGDSYAGPFSIFAPLPSPLDHPRDVDGLDAEPLSNLCPAQPLLSQHSRA